MVDEISDFITSPFSPGVNPDGLYFKSQKGRQIGENLFQEASHFYSWYKSVKQYPDSPRGEKELIIIMQIANLSLQTGCLTAFNEENAIRDMQELREHLYNGQKRMDQIPEALQLTEIHQAAHGFVGGIYSRFHSGGHRV